MNINGRDSQQYSVTLVTCSSTRGRWVKVGPSDMASQWKYTDEDLQDNTFQVITDEEADMIRNLDAVDYMVKRYSINLLCCPSLSIEIILRIFFPKPRIVTEKHQYVTLDSRTTAICIYSEKI